MKETNEIKRKLRVEEYADLLARYVNGLTVQQFTALIGLSEQMAKIWLKRMTEAGVCNVYHVGGRAKYVARGTYRCR